MTTEKDWEGMFRECGAFWSHDGNRNRPYARLTSGLISDGFFNGGRVAEDAPLFGLACSALWRKASEAGLESGNDLRVIGAAMGGIALSTRIAEAAECKSGFAEKKDLGLALERPFILPRERFLLVEDTITTGGTLLKLKAAGEKASPGCRFAGIALAICNRSGYNAIDNFRIISLISPVIRSWEEGQNPFTPDGTELVDPVKPKANWDRLVGSYA